MLACAAAVGSVALGSIEHDITGFDLALIAYFCLGAPLSLGWTAARRLASARRVLIAAAIPSCVILLAVWVTVGDSRSWGVARLLEVLVVIPLVLLAVDRVVCVGATVQARTAGRRRFRWAVSAMLLGTPAAMASYGYLKPPPQPSRFEVRWELFDRLASYAHWDDAPLAHVDHCFQYYDRLDAAEEACGEKQWPCPELLRILREMLAELRNGHTDVLIDGDIGDPDVLVERIEGQAVITWVAKGSDAEALGVLPGMVIHNVDTIPVEEAVENLPKWDVAYASPETRRNQAYQSLLHGPPSTRAEIWATDGDDRLRAFFLERKPVHYMSEEEEEDDAWSIRLRDEIPVLRVQSFNTGRFDHAIREKLREIPNPEGFVVDLRENVGGHTKTFVGFLGLFWNEPLHLGKHCSATDTDEAGEPDCVEWKTEPDGLAFTGPLAVLIDEETFSAAELAAHALCRSGRARCFGRRTAGESDTVFRFEIPGAHVGIASAAFRPAFGPDIYGAGVEPHVHVERTIDDVRADRDPDFEAARSWLLRQGPLTAREDLRHF